MPSTTPQKRSHDGDIANGRHRRPRRGEVHTASASGTSKTAASEIDMDDDSGELSESSEEPSSDEDSDASDDELPEDAPVVNLRANRGKKPTMKFSKDEYGPDIRDFLKDFLPQLKASNDELMAEQAAGTLKDKQIETEGDEEEQYIEMDLGLGVLEERDPDAKSESSESENESDGDTESKPKEKDILGLLMGRHKSSQPVGIQEVEGKP